MSYNQFSPKLKPLRKPSPRRYIMPVSVLVIGLGFIAVSLYLLGQPPATQAVIPFGRGMVSIKTDASYSLTVSPTRTTNDSGTTYQIDPAHKTIQKFDKNGSLLAKWGGEGSQDGQFNNPQLIGLDLQDQVYVYDKVNSIQKFDANGRFLARWPASIAGNDGIDLAVNEAGKVYVLLQTPSRSYLLQQADATGQSLTQSSLDWSAYDLYTAQVDSEGRLYTLNETHNGPILGVIYRISEAAGNGIYLTTFSSEARTSSRLGWGFFFFLALVIMLIGLARLLEVGLKDLKIVQDSSYDPVKRLNSPDRNLRAIGARELGILADPSTFELLLKAFYDADSMVRGSAAWALGRVGGQRAVEPLLQALPKENAEVQVNIIIALGELGDKRAVEPLLASLGSPYPDLRSYSAVALGKLGDERGVAALKEGLFNQQDYNLCQPLLQLGKPGLKVLMEALGQSDPELRKKAVMVLGLVQDNEVMTALIEVLEHDQNNEVRLAAIGGLGNLRAWDALPILTELANNDSAVTSWGESLKDEAKVAIQKIKVRV